MVILTILPALWYILCRLISHPVVACSQQLPPTPTPFAGDSTSWYRPRILLTLSSLLSRLILCPYCSLLAGAAPSTPPALGDCLLWGPDPPTFSHSPSRSFLLVHLHSFLMPTDLKMLCLPGNPQPPHLPRIQRGQQKPMKKTPNKDKTSYQH